MQNSNMLEELRTKEELINYFKALGKNITEEEIEILKKNYEQTRESSNALSLKQLDDIAGGFGTYRNVKSYVFRKENAHGLIFERGLFERDFRAETKGRCSFEGKVVVYDGILGVLGIGRVIKMEEQSPEMQLKFSDCTLSANDLTKQMFALRTLIGGKSRDGYLGIPWLIQQNRNPDGTIQKQLNQQDPMAKVIINRIGMENNNDTPIYSLVDTLVNNILLGNTYSPGQISIAEGKVKYGDV